MNPFVLCFADGSVFFAGLGLAMAAGLLARRFSGRWLRRLASILWLLGMVLIILSATPLPLWCYAIGLGLATVGFIAANQRTNAPISARRHFAIAALNILPALALAVMELPHHLTPIIEVSSVQPVYVIGDSISAGIGARERAWPDLLADHTHLQVSNLAQPGATAETALKQAARVDKPGALIIIEIGGNDLLSGTDSGTFRRQLDQLLARVSRQGNQVILFETPLFPFRNRLGAAQRELAAKYHVRLLPKEFLTRVFGREGGTLDGLHLSPSGHAALAGEVREALRIQ